jgi:AcrR family transcriptional regulator
MSLMEIRAQETRQKLIDAARAGFLARGYAATGTADILRAAGVQRGTLYHHFTDKAALLEAVARQLNGEALLAIANACFDAPGAELPAGCVVWLDQLDRPGHALVWLREVPAHLPDRVDELAGAGFRGWLEDRLRAEIDVGRFGIAARPDVAARMIEGALSGLAGMDKASRDRLVQDLLSRFSRAPGNDYLKLLAAGRG